VIIPNILNSFFASFSGIEKVMEGIQVMCISNESAEKEAHTLEMLSNGTIDGFIVSVSELKKIKITIISQQIVMGLQSCLINCRRRWCDKVIVDDFDCT
jgi:LacI family transcriptional regulator